MAHKLDLRAPGKEPLTAAPRCIGGNSSDAVSTSTRSILQAYLCRLDEESPNRATLSISKVICASTARQR
jgi:hypothetical protein